MWRSSDQQVVENLKAALENSFLLFHSDQSSLRMILYSTACQESFYLFSNNRSSRWDGKCFRSEEPDLGPLLGASKMVFEQ